MLQLKIPPQLSPGRSMCCLKALAAGICGLWMAACGSSISSDKEPQRLLEQGREQIRIFNFQAAKPLFEDAASKLPEGSDDWSEAMIGVAISHWHRTPGGPDYVKQAVAALETLLAKTAATSHMSAEAVFTLGRIAEVEDYAGDVPDLEEARRRYREVIEKWPGLPVAEEAGIRLAGTYLQEFKSEEQVREGIRILEEWLRTHPESAAASLASRLKGDSFLLSLDDRAAALEAFLAAERQGLLTTSKAGNFYWMLASLAEEEDRDIDTAIRFYQRVISETPRSGRAFEAQLALQRLRERFPDRTIEIPEIPLYNEPEKSAGEDA